MTNQELQTLKNKFDIIGNDPALNRAFEIAVTVAPTDITVLVTGESGSGKEFFPKIIHDFGARKHNKYIAVNCGAIPEGTIDSCAYDLLRRTMMKHSDKVYYLADHKKASSSIRKILCDFSEIDTVISDYNFSTETKTAFPNTEFIFAQET